MNNGIFLFGLYSGIEVYCTDFELRTEVIKSDTGVSGEVILTTPIKTYSVYSSEDIEYVNDVFSKLTETIRDIRIFGKGYPCINIPNFIESMSKWCYK